jgi:hypothetical protein
MRRISTAKPHRNYDMVLAGHAGRGKIRGDSPPEEVPSNRVLSSNKCQRKQEGGRDNIQTAVATPFPYPVTHKNPYSQFQYSRKHRPTIT